MRGSIKRMAFEQYSEKPAATQEQPPRNPLLDELVGRQTERRAGDSPEQAAARQRTASEVVDTLRGVLSAKPESAAINKREDALVAIARAFENETNRLDLLGRVNQRIKDLGLDQQLGMTLDGGLDRANIKMRRGAERDWSERSVLLKQLNPDHPDDNIGRSPGDVQRRIGQARQVSDLIVKYAEAKDARSQANVLDEMERTLARMFSTERKQIHLLGAINQRFEDLGWDNKLQITLSGNEVELNVRANDSWTPLRKVTIPGR